MKHTSRTLSIFGLFLCLLAVQPAMGQTANDQQKTGQPERFVSIDFNNVDINVFIKFISELTGTNFVVDDRVKGKVTILSPAKISIEEAYRVFESVLEVHGYTTVKSGKIIKVVPSPDARSKSIETLIKQETGTPEDKIVTQLIPLRYADANEIKRLFAPLVSKSSVILAYQPTNILIITDVYSNILRLLHILSAIDVTGIGQELSLIPIENGDATKMVTLLESVFKQTLKPKKGEPTPSLRFVADERTNTVIVMASEAEMVRIKSLVAMLDKEVPRGEEGIHVYYLEYAVAEELAKVLQSLSGKQTAPTQGKKELPVVSDKVQITADQATNTLVIMADKDDYRVLEDIVRKLDIPRSMVYIEALFMEVDVSKEFQIGVEWQVAGNTTLGDQNAVVGGSFKSEATILPGTGVVDLYRLLNPSGLALGIFSEAINIGGVSFSNVEAVARAFRKDADVNILSTPQILTTDNEEAKITVGKNVPFQTRTSTSDNDTYNSFEYKDVGKTLKIKPQISKGRLVRLNIFLEITALETESALVEFRPTTLKRTIETTAIVEDGNTIVIGGLIDDSTSGSEQKVPCLGDIPILGYGFRSEGQSSDKTNLYIFLTPHVIKSPEEAVEIYGNKKRQMDDIRGGDIKMYDDEKGDDGSKITEPILLE